MSKILKAKVSTLTTCESQYGSDELRILAEPKNPNNRSFRIRISENNQKSLDSKPISPKYFYSLIFDVKLLELNPWSNSNVAIDSYSQKSATRTHITQSMTIMHHCAIILASIIVNISRQSTTFFLFIQ